MVDNTTTLQEQITLGGVIISSGNSSIPLCVNCAFYENSDRKNCNFGLTQYINIVTGDTLYQDRSAEDMRINSTDCGPNAVWFVSL